MALVFNLPPLDNGISWSESVLLHRVLRQLRSAVLARTFGLFVTRLLRRILSRIAFVNFLSCQIAS